MDPKQRIREFITTELLEGTHSGPLSDDQDLLLSGLVDSLGVVRMIDFLEQSMDVSIPPEDVTLEHFQTVDKICIYLQQQNGKQQTHENAAR